MGSISTDPVNIHARDANLVIFVAENSLTYIGALVCARTMLTLEALIFESIWPLHEVTTTPLLATLGPKTWVI